MDNTHLTTANILAPAPGVTLLLIQTMFYVLKLLKSLWENCSNPGNDVNPCLEIINTS